MFLSNFPFNLLHSLFVRGIDWLGVAEGLNYLALDAGPTQVSGLQAEHILIISALDPDQDIKEKQNTIAGLNFKPGLIFKYLNGYNK